MTTTQHQTKLWVGVGCGVALGLAFAVRNRRRNRLRMKVARQIGGTIRSLAEKGEDTIEEVKTLYDKGLTAAKEIGKVCAEVRRTVEA